MMDKTYTIIPDFLLDYDLSLVETVALSVIYGFCQDGKSDFHGSYTYLARKTKLTRRGIINVVSRLEEKGLVIKETREYGGVKFTTMRANIGGENGSPVVNEIHRGSERRSLGGSEHGSPNNIDIEKKEDNKRKKDIYISQERFDFLASLRSLGVSKETAEEWLQVRKTKRLTNTRIAFDRIADEISRSGRSAEDCIRTSVENSWGGFKAEWMPPKKEEVWHGTMEEYLEECYRNGTLKREHT